MISYVFERRADIARIKQLSISFMRLLTPREPSVAFLVSFFVFACVMFGLGFYIGLETEAPLLTGADGG